MENDNLDKNVCLEDCLQWVGFMMTPFCEKIKHDRARIFHQPPVATHPDPAKFLLCNQPLKIDDL